MSERDAKLMIGAQMNLDQKAAMAQYVIENSGSLHDTTEQVNLFYSYSPILVNTMKCLFYRYQESTQTCRIRTFTGK